MSKISQRLLHLVSMLPLTENMRVLEIGCGSGAAAREICSRFKNIYVLGIDRSDKAIAQSIAGSKKEITAGKLNFRKSAIETFAPEREPLFDLAFAIRVGALDGRHPELEKQAKERIKAALKKKGKLFIDVSDQVIKEVEW